jgi:nucleoside-diphosphate-sugar epimerase
MQKAIVTGGAGFIGSHMIDLLLNKGFKVSAIDDMSNGQSENIGMVPCQIVRTITPHAQ